MLRRLSWFGLLGAMAFACGPYEHRDEAAKGGTSSSSSTGGAGGAGGRSTRVSLPDGTSCNPAPADAPGAATAWAQFLDWHAANAQVCGATDVWPSYQCFTRLADPRKIAAFTSCLMSDGCSSISNEDACLVNPSNPAAGLQLSGNAQLWFQNVCMPKSAQCGFSNDNCSVFSPTMRPELRCAIVDCVEGTCANFAACIQGVRDRFSICKG